MDFDKSCWSTYEEGIKREWFLTNGIGGYASSSLIGANTRRYHGLLVAALEPPTERILVLSKLDESITMDGETYNIYSHEAQGSVMEGFRHLDKVTVDSGPCFTFRIKDVEIEKKISMVYGENTVIVYYHIKNGDKRIEFRTTPLVNFRNHHFNTSKGGITFDCSIKGRTLAIKPGWWSGKITIKADAGKFRSLNDCWFIGMDYAIERERGLDSIEDHFIPGYLEVKLKPYEELVFSVICTIEKRLSVDVDEAVCREKQRLQCMISAAGYRDGFAEALVAAADKFIVYRKSTNSKTIIAGYPWFTDWGRDSMIALPGLTLLTGRVKDAEDILKTFAENVRDGLLPNVFPDGNGVPAYNTVDAGLWFFEAVSKYLYCTGNLEFIRDNLYGCMKQIIDSYGTGTCFGIKMDEDFLIKAGDERTQLTWMDAKVGDWVVTPRHGKAVEINALWYNSLKIMAYLSEKLEGDGSVYATLAENVKRSFETAFWNDEKQCLFDVIGDGFRDGKVRPNQLFALSLSYPVICGEKARKIVDRVMEELYTPYGLRSLSKNDPDYKGTYTGGQVQRDGAYHQGTVWAWLIGPFVTAYRKVSGYSPESLRMAESFIAPFKEHLKNACIGSISEIFDGDAPHSPRGCFAQAWSVAEILRTYVEDILNHGGQV